MNLTNITKITTMKTAGLTIIVLFLFTSCADVTSIELCLTRNPYGFWSGLWHGWIILFSWIGSLFSDDIAIYAINNTGGWYNFGFILGIGILGGGGSGAVKKYRI